MITGAETLDIVKTQCHIRRAGTERRWDWRATLLNFREFELLSPQSSDPLVTAKQWRPQSLSRLTGPAELVHPKGVGCPRASSGLPSATTLPRCMTITRCAKSAHLGLAVADKQGRDAPLSDDPSPNKPVFAASAPRPEQPSGSSIRSSSGLLRSARPKATRCRSPPDKLLGWRLQPIAEFQHFNHPLRSGWADCVRWRFRP